MDKKTSRRKFLQNSSLAAIGTFIGAPIVYGKNMPNGYIPVAVAEEIDPFQQFGLHPDMKVLNDRPWNIESAAHLLDDPITPADKFFIRNNGIMPEDIDVSQ